MTTSNDPDGFVCYSDHANDVTGFGMCSMCGSTDRDVVEHVLPDVERLTDVDPVAASQAVIAEQAAKFVNGVLLDFQTAAVIVKVFEVLENEGWKLASR